MRDNTLALVFCIGLTALVVASCGGGGGSQIPSNQAMYCPLSGSLATSDSSNPSSAAIPCPVPVTDACRAQALASCNPTITPPVATGSVEVNTVNAQVANAKQLLSLASAEIVESQPRPIAPIHVANSSATAAFRTRDSVGDIGRAGGNIPSLRAPAGLIPAGGTSPGGTTGGANGAPIRPNSPTGDGQGNANQANAGGQSPDTADSAGAALSSKNAKFEGARGPHAYDSAGISDPGADSAGDYGTNSGADGSIETLDDAYFKKSGKLTLFEVINRRYAKWEKTRQ